MTNRNRILNEKGFDLLEGKNFDSNEDGIIAIGEFIEACSKAGIREEKAKRLFLELDINKDGILSFRDDMNGDGKISIEDTYQLLQPGRMQERYGRLEKIYPLLKETIKAENEELKGKVSYIDKTKTKQKITPNFYFYNYKVPLRYIKGKDEIKILHLSDLHLERANGFLVTNLEKVLELTINPDITVLTGDICEDSKYLDKKTINVLKKLALFSEKFFVLGNHDYLKGKENDIAKILEEVGYINLTNDCRQLKIQETLLNLYGVDDCLKGTPTTPVLPEEYKFHTNILLTHNLDVLRNNYSGYWDLILSGHLHSGEIDLGLVDGIDFLMLSNNYKNVNLQKRGWKALTWRTLSYISPGLSRHTLNFNVEKPGISLLTLISEEIIK